MSCLAAAVRKKWGSTLPSCHTGDWPRSGSGAPLPPDLPQRLGLWELHRSPSTPFSCAYRLPFTIFQGGMPRASYGDRHCISVVHNGQQTAFDFTSRVIDFTVLTEADPAAGRRALEVGVLGKCKNKATVWMSSNLPPSGSLGLIIFLCTPKANDTCEPNSASPCHSPGCRPSLKGHPSRPYLLPVPTPL